MRYSFYTPSRLSLWFSIVPVRVTYVFNHIKLEYLFETFRILSSVLIPYLYFGINWLAFNARELRIWCGLPTILIRAMFYTDGMCVYVCQIIKKRWFNFKGAWVFFLKKYTDPQINENIQFKQREKFLFWIQIFHIPYLLMSCHSINNISVSAYISYIPVHLI